MTPELFERVAALFLEYRSGNGEIQAQVLRSADAEGDAVAAELRKMLAHDPRGSSFLEKPLQWGPAGGLIPGGLGERWAGPHADADGAVWPNNGEAGASDLPRPVRVGEYAITGLLGSGGMGVVYEARQQRPARTVAVKVIHLGLATAALRRRFAHEAEVLARLSHPGIAHVYEAGVGRMEFADGGAADAPFFAMELVAGEPLTDFARNRQLSLTDRLKLAARVADAVQHAHAKGVIHRDLKPSNILVTDHGDPKVLDFGVARALDADAGVATMHTLAGQVVGTVPYTSPEQLAGDSLGVEMRSDVYSLGVVLYELLSGRLPFDFRQQSLAAAVRIVQEQEPARLGAIDHRFKGDVETIVHKCLEKKVENRYASVADLAADIRRYLANEPILARRQTALYQLRKFARRRRPLFAGIVIALVALVVGAAAALWQGVRAVRASARAEKMAVLSEQRAKDAETARNEAEAALSFLTDMLRSADPGEQGKDVRIVDVLGKIEGSIADRWVGEPLVEARVRWAVGVTYLGLGEYTSAEPHLERACELRRKVLGDADLQTIDAELYLGEVYEGMSRNSEAQVLLDKAWAKHGSGTIQDATTIRLMNNRAVLLTNEGRKEEAGEQFAEAVALSERLLGADDLLTHSTQQSLAVHLDQMGRSAEAGPLFARVLATRRRVYGDEHPLTLETLSNYASWCQRAGRYQEAADLLPAVLEHERSVLGPKHPNTLMTMNALLVADRQVKRYDEAESIGRELLAAATEVFGPGDFRRVLRSRYVASCLSISGRLEDAEAMLRELLAAQRQFLGEESPDVAATVDALGEICLERGRKDEAIELHNEAVRMLSAALPADHPQVTAAHRHHARALLALAKPADAEAELSSMLAPLQEVRGANHPEVLAILHDLAECAEAQGHTEEAAQYRAQLELNTNPPPTQ